MARVKVPAAKREGRHLVQDDPSHFEADTQAAKDAPRAPAAAAPASCSRLIVKNLPRNCDEKRLRAHFSIDGAEVTDVRVMRTKQGTSRMFGFVGFKSSEQADRAREYFSRSFIDTKRIQVEEARRVGDDGLDRPWSRHSKGSSAYLRAHPEKAAATTGAKAEAERLGGNAGDAAQATKRKRIDQPSSRGAAQTQEDPKLLEFLELMQPAQKQMRLWSNDDKGIRLETSAGAKGAAPGSKRERGRELAREGLQAAEANAEEAPSEQGDSEDDEYQEIGGEAAVALKAESEKAQKQERAGKGKGAKMKAVEVKAPNAKSDSDEGSESEAQHVPAKEDKVEMSDLDYLRSKMTGKIDDDDEEEEGEDDDDASADDDADGSQESDGVAIGDDDDGGSGDGGGAAAAGDADGKAAVKKVRKAKAARVAGDENVDEGVGENDQAEAAAAAAAAGDETAEAEETLADHGRLFVRNLAYHVTEAELQALFGAFGPLSELHLPMDAQTRRGKGYGYVTFSLGEHAVRALSALDGTIFQGRLLHIMSSRPPPRSARDDETDVHSKSYKKKKEMEQKAQAGSSHNWNALFMRPEAVGDAMAARYGVDKSDLLDDTDGSIAVKLAQGETHLIAHSKAWLAKHGVSIEALEALAHNGTRGAAVAERSNTLILVKNIDRTMTQTQLQSLFSKFGQLGHVLLAPGNTLALVEFIEVGEAKRAFRSLAYSKVNGVPLFLEWAPVGMLKQQGPNAEAAADGRAGGASADVVGAGENETEEVEDNEGCTLFVKNLNFKTDEAALKALFEQTWKVRSASIVTKRDAKNGGRALSMGYGFVEFRSAADAQSALRRMQNVRLDDHVLQLKLSERRSATATTAAAAAGRSGGGGKRASAKLVVRNVPFEANKRELRELFSAFGQLKTLRLPKKFDGAHRGFAFIEFVSKQEASKALEALQSTHLYGRHLVVQYSEQDDSVEAMRDKVRGVFESANRSAAAKKRKKGGEDDLAPPDDDDEDIGVEL